MRESPTRDTRPNPLKLLLIVLAAELTGCCLSSAAVKWLAGMFAERISWAQWTATLAVFGLAGICAASNAISVIGGLTVVEQGEDQEMVAFARRAMPLTCFQTLALVGICLFLPPFVNLAVAAAAAVAGALAIVLLPGRAALPDAR